jgi:hypothetical protein
MAERFPAIPGHKGRTSDTMRASADSASAIIPSRATLQRVTLRALADLHTGTPLQIVARTGLPREAIQPRISELIELRLVEPTGERRRNPSGRTAAVLRVTPAGWVALATT